MESLVHYSYPAHALSVLGLLNDQRLQGHMCDVVLVVADQRYQAHKSVLAASSEYFQSLFTRIDTSSKVVNLDFCEPDAFEIVLNYIYSSSLFVDKDSLSAIQELGYTLGIPFLTNIVSTRPHASYCVSRKRLSYTEGDDNDVQTRSVIVCRVRNDTSQPSSPNCPPKPSERPSSLVTTELAQPPSELNSCDSVRNSEANTSKSPEQTESSGRRSSHHPYASILKGNPPYISSIRPQLKTSASFNDAEVQHSRMPSCSDQHMKQDSGEQEPRYSTKVSFQGQASELSQTIDRSGPLIKSLLRRSLSMDSPIPVFSPTLELKELQNHEQSVVKLASKASDPEISAHNGNLRTSPIILKSKHHTRCDEQTQVEREHSVKVEPSSPLADPLDIIRITVGEALPVNLKDLQTNYEQCSKASLIPFGKRRERPDNRRYPFKKNKILKEHSVSSEENRSEMVSRSTSDDNENNDKLPPNKIFTCWNCFKVFRSSAGLHRHINMYHNPEKPYACDICHKRFHTNFKVWTHCQTQHGVLQNPASSSSSPVMDDRFQKKLIDMVREREIKKALLWKLKRNKQALQSSTLCKKRARSNFVCPYCGKVFVFQSQYRQHLRTHPAEKADKDDAGENTLFQEQDAVIHQKDSDAAVYACRLCNMKLPSLIEQGDHERGCRHSTVCPYCGLRFSSPTVKKDHEVHCKYKKLTCLECMRTFKSSFSIWRHQVEVHNNNVINIKEQMNLRLEEHNEGMSEMFIEERYTGESLARERNIYNDSSGTPMYDSEDSSSYVPEDLSMGHHGRLVVKEEPLEESVSEREETESSQTGLEEPGVWPCEKCGSLFYSRKDLERHQELLCHIKPFICHICNKAFRTNFRLWSHFQSHMSSTSEHGAKETDGHPPPLSPSPPMTSQNSERPSPQASSLNQATPVEAAAADGSSSPEASVSLVNNSKIQAQPEQQPSTHSPVSRSNSVENSGGAQDAETLFYHAPSLSALTFKRQYMCKLCHRTFKTAFSLWSHEQSHGHV
ncbi:zinc finger and BTB domain-containing protein 21 [Hippocampus comes]|uniref:zinc finger and BTB domain-containing protein 21 n=1 Tax=Hippocampus comes TaxID=109280 RepID=UPI00094E06BE|nr:PREDICTED: zinc finger and BTB domain-containing protein 21 [Hippocampus comes]XP_019750841.1 PREDICTED: zinc finger and BTB domain-containing protein 21 [Hippocampus comes]